MSKIYLVGSLRNDRIPEIAELLREDGHDVFDDWHGAGPKADDSWRSYEINRGRPYVDAILGKAAQNICNFDRTNIMAADTVILVLPAGKSGHLELGLAIGAGKKTHILLDKEYDRWDVMYALAGDVWDDMDTMREALAVAAIDAFVASINENADAFETVIKEDAEALALMVDKPRTSVEHREEMIRSKYGKDDWSTGI